MSRLYVPPHRDRVQGPPTYAPQMAQGAQMTLQAQMGNGDMGFPSHVLQQLQQIPQQVQQIPQQAPQQPFPSSFAKGREGDRPAEPYRAPMERQREPAPMAYSRDRPNQGNHGFGMGFHDRGQQHGGNFAERFDRDRVPCPSHYVDDSQVEALFANKIDSGINFDKYDDIPVEVSGRHPVAPVESFEELTGIHRILVDNIRRARYSRPTPVQKYAVPIMQNRRDLMACAQTGSGKTAAFLFPVINQMLMEGPTRPQAHEFKSRFCAAPSCLIMAPTRELATQIYDEARKFCFNSIIRSVVVYGGVEVRPQFEMLAKGCDILVATPGRLQDLMERGRIRLANIGFLVLDEADRMLDMGFEKQIRHIVSESDMPRPGQRLTTMFSATFPKAIQQLASEFLHDYLFLTVGRVGSTTNFITQKIEWVEDKDKRNFLMGILNHVPGLTLVFVETKREADSLEYFLEGNHFQATSIHGDRTQKEREDALRSFKSGKAPILVATDVAARGLDIPNVAHVVQFDLPTCIDDYVHRIGRTGRAGNTGLATAFLNDKNRGIAVDLIDLLKENSQEVPNWIYNLATQSRGGSHSGSSRGGYHGGRGGGRGGGKSFGARDFRNSNGRSSAARTAAPASSKVGFNQFQQFAMGNYGGNYGTHQLFQPGTR